MTWEIENLIQNAAHDDEWYAIDWYWDNYLYDPKTIVERFRDQGAVKANFTLISHYPPEKSRLLWNPQPLGRVNGKERLRLCRAGVLPASSVGLFQFIVGAAHVPY